MQSTNRPGESSTPVSSADPSDLRGLKIPVSAVRFRPWAPVTAEIPAEAPRQDSGDISDCAELQSSGRPGNRPRGHYGKGAPSLAWLISQTVSAASEHAPGNCWVWQRSKTSDGYARISIGGKDCLAHRVAYELEKGAVPSWLTLDHLCRRRDCINPAHQEPVTQAENTARGLAPTAIASRSGVCQRGHELTQVGNRKRCMVCRAARQREWYERKVSAKGAA